MSITKPRTLTSQNSNSEVLEWWLDKKRSLLLAQEIYEDSLNPTKKKHWIWYVYPNVHELNPKYPAEINLNDYQHLLKIENYKLVRSIIDSKKMSYFNSLDRGRVAAFRSFIKNGLLS